MDKAAVKPDSAFLHDFWGILLPYRRSLIKASVWIIAMQILALVEPYLIMSLINDFWRHQAGAHRRMIAQGVGALIMLGLTTLAKLAKDRKVRKICTDIMCDLPLTCLEKLLRLPLAYHEREQVGEVITAVNGGTGRVIDFIWAGFYEIVPIVVQSTVVCVAMAFVHWSLNLIVIPALVVFFAILIAVKASWARRRQERHILLRKADRRFSQIVDNVLTTQVFNQEAVSVDDVRQFREEFRRTMLAEGAANDRSNFFRNDVANLARIGVIVWSGQLYFHRQFTLGLIVFASMLTERLFNACFTMGGVFDRLMDAVEPVCLISKLLQEQESVLDPETPRPAITGPVDLELDDVSFVYSSRPQTPALQGVSLKIPSGTMIGIVGDSGAGKSTLGKLFPRFHDPSKGSVLVNGINIREMRKRDVRALIGYVSQQVKLYDMTVRDNIRYGRPDATDAEVIAAARLAHADGFIRKLEKGYDAMIGAHGEWLSGGEQQRIGVARAILVDPSILIFDEATSSCDPETIFEIKQAMRELRRGRTFIVITHQIATVQDADVIVVMKDGRLYGKPGTHADLMRTNDIYRKFVKIQQNADASLAVASGERLN